MKVILFEDKISSQAKLWDAVQQQFPELKGFTVECNVTGEMASVGKQAKRDPVDSQVKRTFDILLSGSIYDHQSLMGVIENGMQKAGVNNDRTGHLIIRLQEPASQTIKLGVHTMDGIEFVDVPDIVYGEAKGNYTDLLMRSGARITVSQKISEIDDCLPATSFFRIHHSYIVNLKYVRKYCKGRGGFVVLLDETILPVSCARKSHFLTWLG